MNTCAKTRGHRNSARIFPLAALALVGLGLSACAGAPSETLHAARSKAALDAAAPAPAPVTTARLATLPLDPRRDFDRLRLARSGAGRPAQSVAAGRDFARIAHARAGRFGSDPARTATQSAEALPGYRLVRHGEVRSQRDFERLSTAKAAAAEWPSLPPVAPRDDHLQLASAAVSSDELQAHRGGFVTVDGIQVDFAFQQVSTVNDLQQITSTITLNQMLAGQPGTVTVGDITTSGSGTVNIAGLDGGVTQITHNVLPTTINTVFANTSSGIDASNTVNLVVDIVGIDSVRIGHRVGIRPMNLEIRNALIHALGD